MSIEIVTVQWRRDTKANLVAANRVYADGEPIWAKDTRELAVGDGINNYVSLVKLSFSTGGGGQTTTPPAAAAISAAADNGDGTATLTYDSTQVTVADVGDGTSTITYPSAVTAVDNGDGTTTITY